MKLSIRGLSLATAALMVVSAIPARAGDLEKFFPKETDGIISFNMEQLVGSELVKKYALAMIEDQLKNNPQAQAIADATGLDPLKDFKRITIAGGGDNPQEPKFVIVIDGKFNPKKLDAAITEVAKAKGENITLEKLDDRTVYKIIPPNNPNPIFGAIVDEKNIVFASSKEFLADAFAAAKNSKKSEVRKDLASLFDKADKDATLILVASTKGKIKGLPIPNPDAAKALETLESISAEFRVQSDVKLGITLGAESEDAAKDMDALISEGLKQVKQLAPLLAIQNPQLKPVADMVQSIKNSVKGVRVTLSAELSGEAIDSVIKGKKDN
jgi:hypothetical protein